MLRKGITSQKGYSLIELLLAIALVVIALPTIASLFSAAFTEEAYNASRVKALYLAHQIMNEISSKRFEEDSSNLGNKVEPGELSLSNPYSRLLFDDIDDYDVFSDRWGALSPPRDIEGKVIEDFSDFSLMVDVYNVDNVEVGPEYRKDYQEKPEGSTDFKLVKVTVGWDNNAHQVTLYRIFSRAH